MLSGNWFNLVISSWREVEVGPLRQKVVIRFNKQVAQSSKVEEGEPPEDELNIWKTGTMNQNVRATRIRLQNSLKKKNQELNNFKNS